MAFFTKQVLFLLVSLILITIFVSFSGKGSLKNPEELCRNFVLKNIDSIITKLIKSKYLTESGGNLSLKKPEFIKQYHSCRKYYKEIEFFIEYYSPVDAKFFINGPLVPKSDVEIRFEPFEPMGFQVIEENLFGSSKVNPEVLRAQYDILITRFSKLREYYKTLIIEQPNLLEAMRLEIIRVMCLTLNGYDCTLNKESLRECAMALNGLSKVTTYYGITNNSSDKTYLNLQIIFNKNISHLQKNPDSDAFNRLEFIVKYLNPLYTNLCNFAKSINAASSQLNYAVNFKNCAPFTIASLNKQHFSIYRDDTVNTEKKVELGRLLFFDPILSGNNKRACASCHKPELGFTDGMDKSLAYDGKTKITRNSPTLLNASYQKLFFHDGRMPNLESQAAEVFQNAFEMNTTADEITNKLKQSNEYVLLFNEAFKGSLDTSITIYAVIHSIAEYIKTLESKNSKFDIYIAGDFKQLNKSEINGFNLFTGKALCGSCHFYPLFNGVVPPMFNDNEFEVVGTPQTAENKNLDTDIGVQKISRQLIHKNAFKTPTVRNIEYTAPYMHNGVYKTIDEVLDFYNKGGGAGLGYKVENQTLPFDSLKLSKTELNDLKAFLFTLSDTTKTLCRPKQLPHFTNPDLNKRKIGGEY